MNLASLVLALLVGLASAAHTADKSLVFRAKHDDGSPVALRIFTTKPCTHDRVLLYLAHKFGAPPQMLAQFKAAVLTWQGKDWASCWIEMQGYVVSVDEEGAPFQPIPMSAMRDEGI